jgi:hypothetical protein
MIIGIVAGVLLLLVGIYCYYSRNKSGSPQSKALSEPLLDANQNHEHHLEMKAMLTTSEMKAPPPAPNAAWASPQPAAPNASWASPQATQVKQVWYYRLKGFAIKPRTEPDASSAPVGQAIAPGVFKVVEKLHQPAGIMNLGFEQTYLRCAEGGWLFANHPKSGKLICQEVHSVNCKHCGACFDKLDDKFCQQVYIFGRFPPYVPARSHPCSIFLSVCSPSLPSLKCGVAETKKKDMHEDYSPRHESKDLMDGLKELQQHIQVLALLCVHVHRCTHTYSYSNPTEHCRHRAAHRQRSDSQDLDHGAVGVRSVVSQGRLLSPTALVRFVVSQG